VRNAQNEANFPISDDYFNLANRQAGLEFNRCIDDAALLDHTV